MIQDSLSHKFSKTLLILSFIIYLLISPININAIPSINIGISRQIVLVICLVLIVLASYSSFKLKLPNKYISVFILLRILFFGVYSLFFLESISHYLSYILIISIFPIVFISLQNIRIDPKTTLIHLIKISVVLVGIQTITAFLFLVIQGHGLFQIKKIIAIPFGNSNTIASIAIIQSVLCLLIIKEKYYFFISAITLLFTISKWGLVSFAIVIIIALVMNTNSKHKARNIIVYSGVVLIIYFILNRYLSTYLSVYSNLVNTIFNGEYQSLYNGRDMIFEQYYNLILQRFIAGYGLGIETPAYGMAHNFLVQALYFGGIIGAVIYYLPYMLIVKKCIKNTLQKDRLVMLFLVLSLFVNGFAENVFFTAPSEFLSAIYIALIYRYQISNGDQN